jgi:hypothetical protein
VSSLLEHGILHKPNPTSTTVLQSGATQTGRLQNAEPTLFGALALVLLLRSDAGAGACLSAQVRANRGLIQDRQKYEVDATTSAMEYQAKPLRRKQWKKRAT